MFDLSEFYEDDAQLADEDLATWGTHEFVVAKLEIVIGDRKAMLWGVQIPRRLGGAASGPELSADKKFMRRAAHLQEQLFDRWNLLLSEPVVTDWSSVSPHEKSNGARVDRDEWLRERIYFARRQLASVATVSRQLGLEEWGVKAGRLLAFEISNLERIQSLT